MFNYSSKVVIRKDYIRNDGTASLNLQTLINGKKKVIPLHVHVEPKHFNECNELVKIPRKKSATEKINGIIFQAKSKAEDLFYKSILEEKPLTVDLFMRYYKDKSQRFDFIAWMKAEIEKEKDRRAVGTIKNYYKTLKHLTRFKKSLSFADINYQFVCDFDRSMRSYKQPNGEKLAENTVISNHRRLQKFFNLAIDSGINIVNPYESMSLSFSETTPTFLTPSELQVLVKLYLSDTLNGNLQSVLRQWLFMAFTSLRMSEMKLVEHDGVLKDYLVFRCQKTKKTRMTHKVPLNDFARKMITDGVGTRGLVFKSYKYDDTFNKYMKHIVSTQVGIKKKVTAHVARHTFATTFLKLGGKVEVLQRILGHINIETTMMYVHITNEDAEKQTAYFNDYFSFK